MLTGYLSCTEIKEPWFEKTYLSNIAFLYAEILVELEMSVFLDDHALPDTSMRLSDYVLQTFLINIFSLAIAIFSMFKMAYVNFKMAAKIHM